MGPACPWIPRSLTSSPGYLHDGTELRLVLHLLLSHAPLHTGQDGGLEEVPPVVMERPEKAIEMIYFVFMKSRIQNLFYVYRKLP